MSNTILFFLLNNTIKPAQQHHRTIYALSLKPQKSPNSLHLFLCHTISVPVGSLQLLYIALKTVQKIIWAQDHNLSLPLPLLTEAHDLIVAVRPGQDRLPDSGVLVGKDPRPQLVVFSKTFDEPLRLGQYH